MNGDGNTPISTIEMEKAQQEAIDAQHRVNAAALTSQMLAESFNTRSTEELKRAFTELFSTVFNKMSGREANE